MRHQPRLLFKRLVLVLLCISSLRTCLGFSGICNKAIGACECVPQWKGKWCHEFATLPVPASSDIKEANVTTWGGPATQRPIDSTYHIYASEMQANCGITSWMTNSQIVHFVAPAPTGPWTRQGVAKVGAPWAHCGSVASAPDGQLLMTRLFGNQQPRRCIENYKQDPAHQCCKGGASPCGMKHGCVAHEPVARYNCTNFRQANGYQCHTDRMICSGKDLCEGSDGQYNESLLLCQPLACTNNYADCSVAAAARCDADEQCHSFALNFKSWNTGQTPGTWRMTRAKFFAANGAGSLAQDSNWTTFVRGASRERRSAAVGVGNRSRYSSTFIDQLDRVQFNARVAADNALAALSDPDPSITENVQNTLIPAVIARHPNGPWEQTSLEVEGKVGYNIVAPWVFPNGTGFIVIEEPPLATIARAETWNSSVYKVLGWLLACLVAWLLGCLLACSLA